jgi:hypothetical protein
MCRLRVIQEMLYIVHRERFRSTNGMGTTDIAAAIDGIEMDLHVPPECLRPGERPSAILENEFFVAETK